MTNSKDSKTKMTEEDRLRRDEELMNSLKIFHRTENTPDTWPLHLRNTFRSIDTLGHIRYLSYDDEIPAPHSTSAWRREIKLRAKQISDTADRLYHEKPSELTWRLELEKLVDARFCLRTECKTCRDPERSGRLWRSEIEVVTEYDGPITKELGLRRERRVPCQCFTNTYSGLNPLFSNRADQEFSYDPHFTKDLINREHENNSSSSNIQLPKRRPDRLYGLRQTEHLEACLGSPAKDVLDGTGKQAVADLMQAVDGNSEALLVRNFIQSTPFLQRGDPLLFPFLVIEAKSEEGHGHRNCGVQTALPIWALVRSQERLSDLSLCPLKELGGPIVWYISYLGDSWRLSACYVTTASGQKTYQILDLWNGRISSPDGALQILLLLDYIFDWARDLYRPSILQCLRLMSHGVDESMSFVAESDINSIRKRARVDDVAEMELTFDNEAYETPVIDESLLEQWTKYDLKEFYRGVDFNWRVFRPANILKSSFQCLYLTRDNMGSLVTCLATSRSKLEKAARDVLAALRRGPMIITDRILSEMENTWTGENRKSRRIGVSTDLFCSVVHSVTISGTWELVRTIFCIAIDKDALQDIRKHAKRSQSTLRHDGIEEKAVAVDEGTVENFLRYLKSRSGADNLSFALAHISEVWKPLHMLEYREQGTLSHGSEQPIVLEPLSGGNFPIKDVIQFIYKRHKPGGLLEPDAPCLRFSVQLERFEIQHLADPPRSLPLSDQIALPKIPSNGAIFLCNKNRDQKHLCIYITKEYDNPPQNDDLISVLMSIIYEERFFLLGHGYWDEESRKAHSEIRPGDEVLLLIKTAAQVWAEDFYKLFVKELKEDQIPGVLICSKDERLKLREAGSDHNHPFSIERYRPKKAARVMSQNSDVVPASQSYRSKDAEIQVLLEKWGAAELLETVLNVIEADRGKAPAQDEALGTFEQPIDLSLEAEK